MDDVRVGMACAIAIIIYIFLDPWVFTAFHVLMRY